MSRQYRVYCLSDPLKAGEILGAIGHVDGVTEATFSEDLAELKLDMDKEKIASAMDQVVNICRKISDGCEVRYKFV